MQAPILENVGSNIEVPKDLVSFEDCPYHCNKGKIFDPYKHTTKPCPYCTEKRRTLLRQAVTNANNREISQNLLKRLNLKPNLGGTSFDIGNVIPEVYKDGFESDTYNAVKNTADALMNKATLGELPEFSMMFYFGMRCNVSNFIYPLLVRYYIAGVEVAPLMTGRDLVVLRHQDDAKLYDMTYDDILRKELCVVWLDSGYTTVEVDTVKGLMETRAFYDLPTIIIIGMTKSFVWSLTHAQNDTKQTRHLATAFVVSYKRTSDIANMGTSNKPIPSNIAANNKNRTTIQNNGAMSVDDLDAIIGK